MSPRNIDATVAEKVMDAAWFTTRAREFRWLCSKEFANNFGLIAADMSLPEGQPFAEAIPKFSTDPAASKQLRNKMRADGWNYHLMSSIMSGSYVAHFFKSNDLRKTSFLVNPLTMEMVDVSEEPAIFVGKAEADTEEMAVALATLKAKSVEAKEGK